MRQSLPAPHVLVHISKQVPRGYVDLSHDSIIIAYSHHALQNRSFPLMSCSHTLHIHSSDRFHDCPFHCPGCWAKPTYTERISAATMKLPFMRITGNWDSNTTAAKVAKEITTATCRLLAEVSSPH